MYDKTHYNKKKKKEKKEKKEKKCYQVTGNTERLLKGKNQKA